MADYGPAHRRLRALLLSRYVPGVTRCWRCGQPITALNTRDVHLGHDDTDPRIWRGLECKTCNLRAGGIKRAQMAIPLPRRARAKRSRIW